LQRGQHQFVLLKMRVVIMLLLCLVAYCSGAALSNGHHDHHHDHDHDHDHHHEDDNDHGDHKHHHADHLYHHEDHDHNHDEHDHPQDHNEDHDHDEIDHEHPHNHQLGDHLGQLLNRDQDHYHPSLKPDGQVVVETMLKVRSVGPIDPKAKTLTLVLTHREKFSDSRLADEGRSGVATLIGKDCDLIWTPDTFFRSSVEEEVIGGIKPNCLARVDPAGNVLVSRRIKIKSVLEQELPLQPPTTVTLSVASYGYKKDDVAYTGSPDSVTIGPMAKKAFDRARLAVSVVSVENDDVTTKTGEYSALNITFKLDPLV